MAEDDGSKLIILRFQSQEDLESFYKVWKESGLGELVKSVAGDDYENNQESDLESKWSDWGAEHLDEKKAGYYPLT